MSNEAKNVFERKAAQPTLADDRKNRFAKHDEARRVARRASDTQVQREERRQAESARWNRKEN
jgi:hypothetical protein